MTAYSQHQIMLSLSLLSYRGFWNPDSDNQQSLVNAIRDGLNELEPLKGNWQLAWGPGTYRYLGSIFDSSMMYVVQHKTHNSRYAIVVRGTNPIDAFDWLLGDLLPHKQVPWKPANQLVAPDARLSLSTALGLKILLNMRAESDPAQTIEPGKFDTLFDVSLKTASSAQDAGTSLLKSSKANIRGTATGRLAYYRMHKLARKLLRYQGIWKLAGQIAARGGSSLGTILPARDVIRVLSIRRRMIALLDASVSTVGGSEVDMLMPDPQELADEQAQGIGLLEFLGNLAARHGNSLELFVTGHSKGAALAPALALYLSDTQNKRSIPAQYQWNPAAKAAIYCYIFAGPTPGNGAFAEYFNRQLGRTFYSHINKLDIVTRAWQSDKMRTIPGIFGDSVNGLPGLDLLFDEIADEVENLDYRHLGQDYRKCWFFGRRLEKHIFEFAGPLQENQKSYVMQELYQHVEAYIDQLSLQGVIKLQDLMGPSTAQEASTSGLDL